MNEISKRISRISPAKQALLDKMLRGKGGGLSSQKAIPKKQTRESASLSYAQERLWFFDQMEPGNSVYNVPLVVRLTGHLNVTALEQSLSEILKRHEVLRTTFITENDQPVQKIAPVTVFTLPQADLNTMPEEKREAKARQLAIEESSHPFDLTTGPLLRVTLLRLTPQEHVLLSTVHHIVFDGWSWGIFYRELSALYEAFSQGNPSPLPELPIQYADFAVWQRQWLKGEMLEKQLSYWKEQLRGLSSLELPTDRPRPSVQTYFGVMHTVEFPESLTEALRGLSRKEGATLFMTLLAAFQTLLHRYTGQDDIVVGTPIANRNRAEIEGLIGFFVNTLVMRTDTSGDPVFRELLKQVQKYTLDAYTHQDLPFEKLVVGLLPERDLSRNPLFQVMFTLQNEPSFTLVFPDLTVSPLETKRAKTKFDLLVDLQETREGIKGKFVYNVDLFEAATIERMAGHYQRILEGIVADPDQRLSELPLMTEAERHQLLVEWNDTAVDYPRDKCIHELFEEQVERTPDATAVVFEDQQLTYRELNSKANQLAHYLRKQGVGPEVLVGICVERSLEMIIGILGILKAGGAYLPLDPTYPKERLAFMLQDSQTHHLLTHGHLISNLSTHTAHVFHLDRDWPALAGGPAENPVHTAIPGNLIYVIYTSGSTGRPKGCCNIHRAVGNMMRWSQETFQMSAADRILQTSSFSFDISAWEIFLTLISGATLVLTKPGGHMDPGYLIDLIDSRQITMVHFVPSMLSVLLEEDGVQRCLSLQRVFCGGEALSSALQQRFFSRLEAELHNLYGPTEAAIFATHWQCQMQNCSVSVPIGRPVANTHIYILDNYLKPTPIGVMGELCIGGVQVARGYLNRPEITAERFIADPFSSVPGSRLYKTGDLARYRADGVIEFFGRLDHQVKVRGFRIEPGEIEAAIIDHPQVRECVVVAKPDEAGDKRLLAYLVAVGDDPPSPGEIRGFLEKRLPAYMVPSAFVVLSSLPLTPNGKVERTALPEPDLERSAHENAYQGPRTPIEELVAGIWTEVLGLKEVGIHDNFFELGGHSLLATQVVSRLRKVLQVETPLRFIFEAPTPAGLAVRIAQSQAEIADPEELARILDALAESASDSVSGFREIEDERHE